MADKAMYKPIEYTNAAKKGPQIIVIPGEIKSNNASFTQKFGPNNIADYAELELGKANFKVLERSDLGPLLNEFTLAYTMGNPQAARKVLQKASSRRRSGSSSSTSLKAEPVAQANQGFDGQALGSVIGIAGGTRGSAAAGVAVGSVKTEESTGVWIIGMRYKLINANTTEQVATGYAEENGTRRQSRLPFSASSRALPAASPSTPWSSAWCRRTSGKSTPSTSDRRRWAQQKQGGSTALFCFVEDGAEGCGVLVADHPQAADFAGGIEKMIPGAEQAEAGRESLVVGLLAVTSAWSSSKPASRAHRAVGER